MRVRREEPGDIEAVRTVNEAAFESATEADIVDAVRESGVDALSLVAQTDERIVGHILFSPVLLAGHVQSRLMGLGPMAVLPTHQGRGIGSALVREGLEGCKGKAYDAVVVLGHPGYYPRFGFVPASRYGIGCEYDVPDEVFMLIELRLGSLAGVAGKVIYDAAFGSA